MTLTMRAEFSVLEVHNSEEYLKTGRNGRYNSNFKKSLGYDHGEK
jgi:hypothetical protein